MRKHTVKYVVDLGVLGEQEFAVEYMYSPGYADTRYEPGEPASIEINSVTCVGFEGTCQLVEDFLCGDGYNDFCEEVWPSHSDEDRAAELADIWYQQAKDRKIEMEDEQRRDV